MEKKMQYQKIQDDIWHIPGENKGFFSLCGTNVFIIGEGPIRSMIDAGEYKNLKYLSNLRKFLSDQ
jgi:hypothetical protein